MDGSSFLMISSSSSCSSRTIESAIPSNSNASALSFCENGYLVFSVSPINPTTKCLPRLLHALDT